MEPRPRLSEIYGWFTKASTPPANGRTIVAKESGGSSIPESYRWVPPAVPTGLPFNVAQLFMRMVKAFAKESP